MAYDTRSRRLFVVNAAQASVEVLDAGRPSAPANLFDLTTVGVRTADGSTIPDGAVATSVDVRSDGRQVFGSGDDFERLTAEANPEFFNSNHTESGFAVEATTRARNRRSWRWVRSTAARTRSDSRRGGGSPLTWVVAADRNSGHHGQHTAC